MSLASLCRKLFLVTVPAFVMAAAVGCASPGERLLGTGITTSPTAPEWVTDGIMSTEDMVFVVGRGTGLNVLDEKGAFDSAMAHAAEQIARMVQVQVESKLALSDHRASADHIPSRGSDSWQVISGDLFSGNSTMTAALSTDALVQRIEAMDTYWERWQLRTSARGLRSAGTHTRYKCWVLAGVSRSELQAMASLLEENLKLSVRAPTNAPTTLRVVGQ